MLISNVKAAWCQLNKADKFGRYGMLVLLDKEKAKDLKKNHGLNVQRVQEEIPGIEDAVGQYFLRINKLAEFDGVKTAPPPVVDMHGEAVTELIGNGSLVNVILLAKPYDFKGKKGVSAKLRKVQIVEHVKFEDSEDFDYREAPKKKAKPVEDDLDEDEDF